MKSKAREHLPGSGDRSRLPKASEQFRANDDGKAVLGGNTGMDR